MSWRTIVWIRTWRTAFSCRTYSDTGGVEDGGLGLKLKREAVISCETYPDTGGVEGCGLGLKLKRISNFETQS